MSSDYWQGRADDLELHGIDPAAPQVPLELCPTHGVFEFNLWHGCPVCDLTDEAAFEASKQYRPDEPHIPVRRHPNAA